MKRTTYLLALLLIMGFIARPVNAQGSPSELTTTISERQMSATAGDWIAATTTITNEGSESTPALVAHLLITSATGHVPVDPEDWVPFRTQYLPALAPGESLTQQWRIHLLIEGDFIASITFLSVAESFASVATPSLVMTVAPDDILPLGSVVPLAATMPLIPLLMLGGSFAWNRRKPAKAYSSLLQ